MITMKFNLLYRTSYAEHKLWEFSYDEVSRCTTHWPRLSDTERSAASATVSDVLKPTPSANSHTTSEATKDDDHHEV